MTSQSIPVGRVIDRLNAYYEKNDTDGAERHLLYWKGEAESLRDMRGLLTVLNELMGFYRKAGKKEQAIDCAVTAAGLTESEGLSSTITAGTVFLNCATVFTAFEETGRALQFFAKAEKVYSENLPQDDRRMGGLFNNMASAFADAGRTEESLEYYFKALEIMGKYPDSAPEQAVTYLNIADVIEEAYGAENDGERIEKYVSEAAELLNSDSAPRDGHYAFVCEKCAPAFEYYGRFVFAKELEERAKIIYEGN